MNPVEAHQGKLAARGRIMALEAVMLALPQEDIPVTHTFCDGMYARAALIKKGMAITGSIHRQGNLNIMISGDVTVVTDEGASRLRGFNIIASQAGTKRAGYTHEDTVWVTILRTDETDVAAIERTLVTNEYADGATIGGQ